MARYFNHQSPITSGLTVLAAAGAYVLWRYHYYGYPIRQTVVHLKGGHLPAILKAGKKARGKLRDQGQLFKGEQLPRTA